MNACRRVLRRIGPALILILPLLAVSAYCGENAREDYYNIFLNGKKVGYQSSTLTVDADGNLSSCEQVFMSMKRFGQTITASSTTRMLEKADGTPIAISYSMNLSSITQTIDVKFENGRLKVTRNAGGPQEFAADPVAMMPEAARRLLAGNLKSKGRSFTFKSYVPPFSLEKPVETTVEVVGPEDAVVVGKSQRLFRVRLAVSMPPSKMSALVDEEGFAWKLTEEQTGISIEKTTKEDALRTQEAFDLSSLAIASNVVFSNELRRQTDEILLEATCDGGDVRGLFLATAAQSVKMKDAGRAMLTVKRAQRGQGEKNEPAELARFLSSTAYLQCDDPAIAKAAQAATEGVSGTWEEAKALERFVNRHIVESDFQTAFASAKEVLETRKGDCTEFAVLLAALCRASGIPSRLVVGLVGAGDIFFYHMWVEAYVDGWTSLDATDPQPSVDPTHLAMARMDTGSEQDLALSNQKLMASMGRIKFKVIYHSANGKRIYPAAAQGRKQEAGK